MKGDVVHGTPEARGTLPTRDRVTGVWSDETVWQPPVTRAALVRAVPVTVPRARTQPCTRADTGETVTVPGNARTLVEAGLTVPGTVARVTYALGYDVTADGHEVTDTIWQASGEYTEKGTARKTKVGTRARDAVPSIRVVHTGRAPGGRADGGPGIYVAALWIDGRWDSGFVGELTSDGRVRNVRVTDWRTTLAAFNSWREQNSETLLNVQGDA